MLVALATMSFYDEIIEMLKVNRTQRLRYGS